MQFLANPTVGPGPYQVRLKFTERRQPDDPKRKPIDISINGRPGAQGIDIAAKAGGTGKTLDLTCDTISPANGIIEVRFKGRDGGEAFVQALQILPAPAPRQ